jgi:hypothetical protein
LPCEQLGQESVVRRENIIDFEHLLLIIINQSEMLCVSYSALTSGGNQYNRIASCKVTGIIRKQEVVHIPTQCKGIPGSKYKNIGAVDLSCINLNVNTQAQSNYKAKQSLSW